MNQQKAVGEFCRTPCRRRTEKQSHTPQTTPIQANLHTIETTCQQIDQSQRRPIRRGEPPRVEPKRVGGHAIQAGRGRSGQPRSPKIGGDATGASEQPRDAARSRKGCRTECRRRSHQGEREHRRERFWFGFGLTRVHQWMREGERVFFFWHGRQSKGEGFKFCVVVTLTFHQKYPA